MASSGCSRDSILFRMLQTDNEMNVLSFASITIFPVFSFSSKIEDMKKVNTSPRTLDRTLDQDRYLDTRPRTLSLD